MHACTIIAKNYLAQARVLARSFLEHNPGSQFTALIIDGFEGLIDLAEEPFTVLTPAEIGCQPFVNMASRYDVLELCTAVKPWLLRHQLATGAPAITYLDPDIQVFGSLELLDRQAREHVLALTPHNTQPIPGDGKRPTQIDILSAGVYNLGCLSLGQSDEVDALLDWWSERLEHDCRVDPLYGYFVDQRWFDLVPGFVTDFAIVRESEYNVAYWNLHSRGLEYGEEGYTVDGRPLAFFHFSGFDPARPDVLSRHQTRIELAHHPALGRICGEYAKLTHADGYAEARAWPYTYDRLADDTPFSPPLRQLYARGQVEGALSASPFEHAGCATFLQWGAEQEEGAPSGLTRVLAAVHQGRPDLRNAFPDLRGPDGERFLHWIAEQDHAALQLPSRLVPSRSTHELPSVTGTAALRSRLERGPVAPAHSAAGPFGHQLRRLVLRVIKPFTSYQSGVNEEVHRLLQAQRRDHDAARHDLDALRALHQPIVDRLDGLRALHQPIVDRLDGLRRQFERREAETQSIPYMSGTPFPISRHPAAGVVQGYHGDSDGSEGGAYRSFEDIFRGSEAFIRDRQRKFLELIGDRQPVLDFGCGRGEFLDLLRENGRPYLGVDSDAGMVQRCKEKRHDQVVLADGLEYLHELAPRSLGAIFCAQVIEHLPYEQLLRFFSLAHQALAEDGLLIAETVNPHSPPALKTFWVDLTHQHPVFPEVALAMCRSEGFAEAFVFHPNGVGDVEVDRYSQGEYAVVAKVRAQASATAAH